MARTIVIDAEKKEVRIADCTKLDDFYREIGHTPFDIVTRPIGGKLYDIFVDDEGLFRENPIVSAVDSAGNSQLVGNLIIANHDARGNTTSLTNDDIRRIKKNIRWARRDGDSERYLVLVLSAQIV